MSEHVNIQLPEPTVRAAIAVGVNRQFENAQNRVKNAYGMQVDNFTGFEAHIRGAVAEAAVCAYLNLFWTGTFGMREPDVGNCIEVRSGSKKDFMLRLTRKDDPDAIFVLAFPNDDLVTTTIIGWLYAGEGQIESNWQRGGENFARPRDFFYVPQDELHDMRELRKMFSGRRPMALADYRRSQIRIAGREANV